MENNESNEESEKNNQENHETLQLKDPLENQLQKSTPFKLVACLAPVGRPKGAQSATSFAKKTKRKATTTLKGFREKISATLARKNSTKNTITKTTTTTTTSTTTTTTTTTTTSSSTSSTKDDDMNRTINEDELDEFDENDEEIYEHKPSSSRTK